MAGKKSLHPFEFVSNNEEILDYELYNIYQSSGYVTVKDYLANLESELSRRETFSNTVSGDLFIAHAYSGLLRLVLNFFGLNPIVKDSPLTILKFLGSDMEKALRDYGFIRQVNRVVNFSDFPKFYTFSVKFAKPPSDGFNVEFYEGNGTALQLNVALSKAIGEAIERRTMITYNLAGTHIASLKEMHQRNEHHLDLFNVEGFSLKQRSRNAYLKFDETTNFHWVRGKELVANDDAWIPAQLVFWSYNPYKAKEPIIREPITSGDSGMFSKTGAILNGIYEVIERDAFFIFWLNRLTPKKIDPASIPNSAIQDCLNELYYYGFTTHILDIGTEFGVPVYAVVIVDRFSRDSQVSPAMAIGAAANMDPFVAIEKALLESMAGYTNIRLIKTNQKILTLSQIYNQPEMCKQKERILFWTKQENLSLMDFFLSGQQKPFKPVPVITSPDIYLRELLQKFRQRGYPVYVYEPKMPSFLSSYHVMRAIIPHLQPIYLSELYRPDGGKRLHEAPIFLGYKPAEVINPLPHPFP